ncbi:MAG TPA: tetratricopeptide repeat protein [Desulfuromonadales bacterium]|nr:tetratricopeptide repeat protein [Desulfuromonadales bacterium]
MRKTIQLCLIGILSILNSAILPAYAKTESFVKVYTYEAGEADSKLTCRTIALEQVKRLLLEELGTYLISSTEVINSQLTKDQIVTYTSGIVMTVIIDEKWDGKKYTLKAKVTADPEDVAKTINLLRKDREKTEEMRNLQEQTSAAMKEIDQLAKELATTKLDKLKQERYLNSVNKLLANETVETGVQLLKQHKFKDAVKTLTNALTYNPESVRALYNRGWAYFELKKYDAAAKDFDSAIKIKPTYLYPHYGKGRIAIKQGRLEEALSSFEKIIVADPEFARGYNGRGIYFLKTGLLEKAKSDFDKALELNHQYAAAYINRGLYYYKISELSSAINDFNKGIVLDPRYASSYFYRGNAYSKLKNMDKAMEDYRMAADLGYVQAKKKLERKSNSTSQGE